MGRAGRSPSRVFLTDFGLARWGTGQVGLTPPGSRITRSGVALGTPAYMSPEQARGEHASLTPATDVWSLGCVAYELLAGRRAFDGDSPAEIVAHVLTRPPLPLREAAPNVPRTVDWVVCAALARPARHRPRDARALHDDLARVALGQRPRARPPRSGRGILAIVALLLAAAAVRLAVGPRPSPVGATGSRPDALAAEAFALRLSSPRDAARLLGEALATDPRRDAWRVERGLLCWALGANPEARAEWARVPEASALAGRARLYRALEAMFRFAAREAIDEFDAIAVGSGPNATLARGAATALREQWAEARALLAGGEGWEAALLRAYLESGDPAGDPAAAVREYDQAFAEGIAFAWGLNNRGELRRRLGDFPGAVSDCDAALRLDPGLAAALNNRGLAKRALGDVAEAIADYDAALRLRPTDPEVLNNRGIARRLLGDHAGALTDLDAVIRLTPLDPHAFANRAELKSARGDHAGAIADYDAALRLAPGDAVALNNRGAAKRAAGDLRGAIADLDVAVRLLPAEAEPWFHRGDAKRELGDLPGAIADYDVAIRLRPDYPEALNNRGIARHHRGDRAGAIADFDAALRLQPDYPAAFFNRAFEKAEAGDLRGAIADLDAGLRSKPDDAHGLERRGAAKHALGDARGAIEDFDAALRQRPGDADLLNHRGAARGEVGDARGAMEDFAAAVQSRPSHANAQANLGVVCKALGEWARAVEAFEAFLRLAPAHPRAEQIRGLLAECEAKARELGR